MFLAFEIFRSPSFSYLVPPLVVIDSRLQLVQAVFTPPYTTVYYY